MHKDVLKVDFGKLAGEGRIRLVGNLPYNISTPILFHVLEHAEAIVDMHFMLQKEVVDRMAAAPGSKVYGRLSVMLQAICDVEPLFVVGPEAFRPPPKVDSAVVRPAAQGQGQDRHRSTRPCSSGWCATPSASAARPCAMQSRRSARREQIIAAGLRPELRAEQLAVAEFIGSGQLPVRKAGGDGYSVK